MTNVQIVISLCYVVLTFMYFCSFFVQSATIVSTKSEFKDAVIIGIALCYFWSTATNDSTREFFSSMSLIGLGLYLVWRIQASNEE